jgi:hypothetical protein
VTFFLLLFVPPILARKYIVYIIFNQEKKSKQRGQATFTSSIPLTLNYPLKSSLSLFFSYLLALLQDAATFYAGVIITLIALIIFRTKPRITRGAATGRTTKRTRGAAAHRTAIGTCCATDAIVAVDGVI